ncbi:MAG: LacI family DNA-binding transcriptional regulator [Janthinobacterium lividum]
MNSIREVAKQAGVSTATVSRAFNTPELISALTHKRVLETADRLNYRPLRARQRPAAISTNSVPTDESFIGFQFFGASPNDLLQANAFYAPLLAGAQIAAAERGMHLLVHTTDRHQLAQQLPKMVREQTVNGMLLVGTADPEILAVFLERVPQIVLVDHRDPTCKHDCIISDGLGGAMEATKYLFELGHERIAFLRDDASAASFQDRLRGFVCAHFEAGRTVDPRLIVTASSEENIPSALHDLLASTDRPTALLAANDRQALAVMQVCRTLGLGIPEELSLIGFDDIDFSAHTWPPLTTVRVPKEQIGRLAVTRLQERLRTPDNSLEAVPPITLEVPVSLIVRQSCRALV